MGNDRKRSCNVKRTAIISSVKWNGERRSCFVERTATKNSLKMNNRKRSFTIKKNIVRSFLKNVGRLSSGRRGYDTICFNRRFNAKCL